MKVPKKVIDQCLRLYHDNLYVIWPLLSYDDLHKLLDKKYNDHYVYWFLVALSAATLSDLQSELESEGGFSFTGKQLAVLCMSSRQQFDDLSGRDIFRIMTYYCLLRCFSQSSDVRNSYRLCREAIGLVIVAGLHREKAYESLSFREQQLLRKVYYLLLLTERYYSVYVHCVTSLDTTIAPPQPEFVTDPRLSLDSFFEMIRVFTVPGKCFFDALATESTSGSCTEDSLKKIWKELHTASLEIEPWSYGYADISFSRHWIRALAWKLMFQMNGTKFFSNANNAHILVEIAKDMLDDIFLTPNNLYVVHGPVIPMKALEIANALVDIVNQHDKNTEEEALDALYEISNFIFSLKHYDGNLIESFVRINVEQESRDDDSVLNFWKRALQARKKYKELMIYGYDFQFIDLDSDQIFSFTKEYEDKTLFAALNFSGEEIEFSLPREGASLSFILGNYDDTDVSSRVLKPWEGRIYLVK
ncbi:transcription factor [Saccharomyces cerevisiae]|nr:transcription factor [Saccharomyces cerevisiae]